MRAAIAAGLCLCAGVLTAQSWSPLECQGEVRFSVGDAEHSFQTEIATTPAERGQGLMFRENLADDFAMLFVYPDERPIAFWMKNTPSSLDILFFNGDGVLQSVAEATPPFSTESIFGGNTIQYVLEIREDVLDFAQADMTIAPRLSLKLQNGGAGCANFTRQLNSLDRH